MLPQEIIRKKRNRQPLSADEISEFIKGITDGSIMDAQTAALTMAVFLNGLNADETVALTMAMRDSGDVLEWKGFDAPIVDKHSSGGVGDKVSLMFTLPHEPGTLNSILGILAVHQMNMLRLESRPMPGKSWEYRFFVDVQGNLRDEAWNSVLFEILENTLTLRILGNYRKGA